jgi:hypothetical protein
MERSAEFEPTRLMLERELAVVCQSIDQSDESIEAMQTTDSDEKRLRLQQMGIEVVGGMSAGPDRVEVVMNLPFHRVVLSRDPNRPIQSSASVSMLLCNGTGILRPCRCHPAIPISTRRSRRPR